MTTVPTAPGTDTDTPVVELDDSFARDLPELVVEWKPAEVPDPELVVLNETLASEIGLDPLLLRSEVGVAMLAGNHVPPRARPVAMGYAGHQFGNYSPRLGDGRAVLLGEIIDPSGSRHDLHLKGSGRTPFARAGDGKATIGPMLREYVIAESLHALGVPTTRALAVATTGEEVPRRRLEPGAVLTRTAASHIRVGTFEYAVRLGGSELVARLADHTIARHHPSAADADEPARALLVGVVEAQAELVADWMLLGFIHGVMNTDNMALSGEGIDYGPCAFMDRFDPATVFSSIDHGGRYAYGNQPKIAQWNLARFAETFVDQLAPNVDSAVEIATHEVEAFTERLDQHWNNGMAAKLGLADQPIDPELFDDLLRAMHGDRLDLTATFRLLADHLRGDEQIPEQAAELTAWSQRWQAELARQGCEPATAADAMNQVNPIYIPRNHILEEALQAATDGDLDHFEKLLAVVTDPYVQRPGNERYSQPAPEDFTTSYQTFCGT